MDREKETEWKWERVTWPFVPRGPGSFSSFFVFFSIIYTDTEQKNLFIEHTVYFWLLVWLYLLSKKKKFCKKIWKTHESTLIKLVTSKNNSREIFD